MPLDIFVFEGTVVQAPNGTGEWNRFAGRPMKDWVADLARVASITVAVGDCATWGGIPATSPNPSESVGLQFLKRDAWRLSRQGLPVQGRPAGDQRAGMPGSSGLDHADRRCAGDRPRRRSVARRIAAAEDVLQSFTQTGCTRNMHFSYKVSATEFGQRKGCLFYDLGCRGPMTHSPCNRILWNRQSSKTRAGMPCLGCTEPEFPFFDLAPGTVFKTQTVMGVPKEMPTGIDKIGYIKLTTAAKAASPRWAEDDIFVV